MDSPHLIILGGGISGLALAWYLQQFCRHPLRISIIEKQPRIGGWIQTIENAGFLFELGPHSCRADENSLATFELISDLHLLDQLIFPAQQANRRFIWTGGQLAQLPTNPLTCLFSSLIRKNLGALFSEWQKPKGTGQDETIYEFILRRFNQGVADSLVDPLVSGIYAGDMRTLSVQACFPKWQQWEQEFGSITQALLKRKRGTRSKPRTELFSFQHGMEALPKALGKNLNAQFLLSSEVTALDFKRNSVEVRLNDGRLLQAQHLFSTLPAMTLSKLLLKQYPKVASLLNDMQSTSISVVNLGYRNSVLCKQGFGYLIPSKEQENILGVVWDSSIFPQQNHQISETRLTVMMGGARNKQQAYLDEEFCRHMALKAVAKQLNIELSPDAVQVTVLREAIPQYQVGHIQALELIIQSLPKNMTILGSSFYGVAVNDCIDRAKKIALEFTRL